MQEEEKEEKDDEKEKKRVKKKRVLKMAARTSGREGNGKGENCREREGGEV